MKNVLRGAAVLVATLALLPIGAGVAQDDAEAQQAKSNFQSFFDPSTGAEERVQLLENGERFQDVLARQERLPVAQETSAVVTAAQVQGDHAVVTYTIELNGEPALRNQRGEMVKENGHWKVSDRTFCRIESMRGSAPPGCPSSARSGS